MLSSPHSLVDAQGRLLTGVFPGSVRRINGRDFDYRTPMGAKQNAFARRFHYKQFQYFGVLANGILAGCALADTAWIGLAFVYVFDTKTRRMHAETFRLPLARGLTMSESPVSGTSTLETAGARIALHYRERADGTLEKSVDVKTRKGLRINATMQEAAPFDVLALCTQTGINGWTYANKVAGIPVTGRIESPLGNVDLGAIGAFGHHDFSAGYMRRETFWNWACLSGRAGEHALGLNISCGVNETGYSENCAWLDGKRHALGLARFAFDRDDVLKPWHVTTGRELGDGNAVDLRFTPAGLHAERLDVGLLATNFKQVFGRFDGELLINGTSVPVNALWGFVEDQYAKW